MKLAKRIGRFLERQGLLVQDTERSALNYLPQTKFAA
jgi:hypothetical protein